HHSKFGCRLAALGQNLRLPQRNIDSRSTSVSRPTRAKPNNPSWLHRSLDSNFVLRAIQVFGSTLPRETETPSVVILPKHAGITLVRQDESIGQHLVAEDRVITNHIVVLDEGHGRACAVGQYCTRSCELAQAEPVGLA